MMKLLTATFGCAIVFAQMPMTHALKFSSNLSICTQMINYTVGSLKAIPNTTNVRFKTTTIDPSNYTSVPTGKTKFYQFSFGGAGAGNILRSPKMMEILSDRVLNACGEPAVLTFGISNTDAFEMYGWVNGKTKRFTCYPSTRNLPSKISWGQRVCL